MKTFETEAEAWDFVDEIEALDDGELYKEHRPYVVNTADREWAIKVWSGENYEWF